MIWVRSGFHLLLILCTLLTTTVVGQSKDVETAIQQYLSIRTEMGQFSGAVLVAKNGVPLFRRGYGFADVERRRPYTPETQQAFASISKMFTALAVLKLRGQGKLRLEDSICKYLKDCPETWNPITVEHLMRHTSGLPDYEEKLELGSDKYLAFMTTPDSSARIVEDAQKLPLAFPPGKKFNYSNTGYVVLSYVVQKAAGMPFAEFVVQQLLRPAGMKNSGVLGTARQPKRLATGYTFGDLGWEKTLAGYPLTAGHLKPLPVLPRTSPAGDAWLYSTVDDLFRWSQIMEGNGFVSAAEVKEVYTAGLGNYGYGWFVDNAFSRKRTRHNGMLPGYVSDFIRFPDEKISIIIASNLDRAPLNRIARDLSAIVLGTPYDLPVRGHVIRLTEAQISALLGDYKTAEGATLTIRKDPDFLVAAIKGRYTAGLIPLTPTEFYFPLGDGKAIFTLGANGQAVQVNMRYSGEDHPAERIAQK